jgi:hypothetical protein
MFLPKTKNICLIILYWRQKITKKRNLFLNGLKSLKQRNKIYVTFPLFIEYNHMIKKRNMSFFSELFIIYYNLLKMNFKTFYKFET